MIPVSPANNIIVRIDKKYQDEIETESGIKLYKDTSFEPGWNATVTGQVVSIPHKLTQGVGGKWNHWRTKIQPEVQVGDDLAFSYMVVFDRDIPKDPEHFFIHEELSWRKEFRNCVGDKIILTYLPDRTVVGQYLDRYDDMLGEGAVGSVKVVEKWASQFKYGGDDKTVYANLMWLNENEEYWSVDYVFAYALRRQGEIKMIGGHVLLEPLEADRGEYFGGSKLIIPEHLRKYTREGIAKVVSIGNPLEGQLPIDAKAGDLVRFDKRFAEKYKFFGKDYLLLKQRRLLAKVSE